MPETPPAPKVRPIPELQRPVQTRLPGRQNMFTRHPVVTTVGTLLSLTLCGGGLGYWAASGGGETGGDHGVAAAPENQDSAAPAPVRNTNPHGRLACALVVTRGEANASAPYKLHTYITEGTAPADAHVTYSATYQRPGAEPGAAHIVGPFITSLVGEPAISGIDQGAPLIGVSGQIEAGQVTPCVAAVPGHQ